MTTTNKTPRLSPELVRRLDALDGCRGRWIVDCRELEGGASYALRALDDASFWPTLGGQSWAAVAPEPPTYRRGSVEAAAQYCAATRWQSRLLFSPELLDDDARWPGGYDAPSVIRSNARVFREDFAKELERADGDADGLALDVRYISAEMLETLAALESYPLISEDDHSTLELELQQEAWESWAAAEWRKELERKLQQYAPEDADAYWGEEMLEPVPDDKLQELFSACADLAGIYWEEQCCGSTSEGYWLDVSEVAKGVDLADLRDLTGLALLAEGQEWRREPYPWLGADPEPLAAPLPLEPGRG